MSTFLNWQSSGGVQFCFSIFDLRTRGWPDFAGIYVLAAPGSTAWQAFYVGKTVSYQDRFCGHSKFEPAQARGATHVLVMLESDERRRVKLEAILISELNPPLNVQRPEPPRLALFGI